MSLDSYVKSSRRATKLICRERRTYKPDRPKCKPIGSRRSAALAPTPPDNTHRAQSCSHPGRWLCCNKPLTSLKGPIYPNSPNTKKKRFKPSSTGGRKLERANLVLRPQILIHERLYPSCQRPRRAHLRLPAGAPPGAAGGRAGQGCQEKAGPGRSAYEPGRIQERLQKRGEMRNR